MIAGDGISCIGSTPLGGDGRARKGEERRRLSPISTPCPQKLAGDNSALTGEVILLRDKKAAADQAVAELEARVQGLQELYLRGVESSIPSAATAKASKEWPPLLLLTDCRLLPPSLPCRAAGWHESHSRPPSWHLQWTSHPLLVSAGGHRAAVLARGDVQ